MLASASSPTSSALSAASPSPSPRNRSRGRAQSRGKRVSAAATRSPSTDDPPTSSRGRGSRGSGGTTQPRGRRGTSKSIPNVDMAAVADPPAGTNRPVNVSKPPSKKRKTQDAQDAQDDQQDHPQKDKATEREAAFFKEGGEWTRIKREIDAGIDALDATGWEWPEILALQAAERVAPQIPTASGNVFHITINANNTNAQTTTTNLMGMMNSPAENNRGEQQSTPTTMSDLSSASSTSVPLVSPAGLAPSIAAPRTPSRSIGAKTKKKSALKTIFSRGEKYTFSSDQLIEPPSLGRFDSIDELSKYWDEAPISEQNLKTCKVAKADEKGNQGMLNEGLRRELSQEP
ncbi:hypothetical protein HK102_002544 [Quaeritorhiza haematococci]|nr:hypothetical protein HK102_002544 [Quaeritorhiza haematococci]